MLMELFILQNGEQKNPSFLSKYPSVRYFVKQPQNGLRQSTRGNKREERLSLPCHIAREEEVGPEARPRSSMIFSFKSSDSESGHAAQLVECFPSCVCASSIAANSHSGTHLY